MKSIPSFAIVIEWDNPRLSETDRARLMLGQLRGQLDELNLSSEEYPEILFLYDSQEVEAGTIERVLEQVDKDSQQQKSSSGSNLWSQKIRIEPTPNLGYYEQKNYGVSQTEGELILFLDSDVIPEADWLRNLLKKFCDPDIQVVGGNTYLTLDNLYSKAFALFWFFPQREDLEELRRSRYFFANNLVIRRSIAEKYPFPDLPMFRGQCRILANKLHEAGVPIYLQTASRVAHPAPNGFKHFVNRALCNGYDDRFLYQLDSDVKPWERNLLGSFIRFVLNLATALKNIILHYRQVKLHPVKVPLALSLTIIYYLLKLIGELTAYVRPQLIRNNFSI